MSTLLKNFIFETIQVAESIENDRKLMNDVWFAMQQKIKTIKDINDRGIFKNDLLVGYKLDHIHPLLDKVDAMFQWDGLGVEGPGITQFMHVSYNDNKPKKRIQIFAGPAIVDEKDTEAYEIPEPTKNQILKANKAMASYYNVKEKCSRIFCT